MSREIARSNIRIQHTTRVGKLSLASDETGAVPRCQIYVSEIETMDSVHNIQQYGFASALPIGTDVVMLTLAGDNANGQIIASNHNQFRPRNLLSGESALHDNSGQIVHLQQHGMITIKGNTSIVLQVGNAMLTLTNSGLTINVPVTVNGNVMITGNETVTGSITATGSITGKT